jgi:hypothetical protein
MSLRRTQPTLKRSILSSIVPEVPMKHFGQLYHNPEVHVGKRGWRHFDKSLSYMAMRVKGEICILRLTHV